MVHMTARAEVRARQPHKRKPCAVRSAADRRAVRRYALFTHSFSRAFKHVGVLFDYFAHIVVGDGGVVIQAHPFREAPYIDAIRLFPRHVDGAEIINIANTDFQNGMAKEYAKKYGLREFAGSDNHLGFKQEKLAGIKTNVKPRSYSEFINLILENKYKIFEYKPKKYGGN